jgi:hypothetical protein
MFITHLKIIPQITKNSHYFKEREFNRCSVMKKSLQSEKEQEGHCNYKWNIEGNSPNHCCHAKAIRITY